MKSRKPIVLGVVGTALILLINCIYFIINTYAQYAHHGYRIYEHLHKGLQTFFSLVSMAGWVLILCCFIGMLANSRRD